MTNENEKWRKFLQPVITGLVAMMAAFTLYAQSASSNANDSRITAVEVQVHEQSRRSDKFDADINNFKVMLSDIRSDVSFIRGKMEKR